MARLVRAPGNVPADLYNYVEARWVRAAIDADDPYIRHIAPAERAGHWFVRTVIAPGYYRQALWAAIGQRAGDAFFYQGPAGRLGGVRPPRGIPSPPAGRSMETVAPGGQGEAGS